VREARGIGSHKGRAQAQPKKREARGAKQAAALIADRDDEDF
jgi:hypothetical protein